MSTSRSTLCCASARPNLLHAEPMSLDAGRLIYHVTNEIESCSDPPTRLWRYTRLPPRCVASVGHMSGTWPPDRCSSAPLLHTFRCARVEQDGSLLAEGGALCIGGAGCHPRASHQVARAARATVLIVVPTHRAAVNEPIPAGRASPALPSHGAGPSLAFFEAAAGLQRPLRREECGPGRCWPFWRSARRSRPGPRQPEPRARLQQPWQAGCTPWMQQQRPWSSR